MAKLPDGATRHAVDPSVPLVVALDDIVDATVVISEYEPDEAHGWDAATGFRARKEAPHER